MVNNIKKKLLVPLLLGIVIVAVCSPLGHCGWLIYHKPEFKGKVIDIETKAPIDGAVVVAIYRKRTMGLGAGTFSSIIEIKETLTDKNGKFRFPPYTTMIQPFSWEMEASFIIYKPGYASFDEIGPEDIFSGKEVNDYEFPSYLNAKVKIRLLRSGGVEIPRVNTKEERSQNIPNLPSLDMLNKQKCLIRAINIEEKYLGLEKTDPEKTKKFLKEGNR